jgi:thiamine biosynthesis lipoprotein
MSSATNDSQTKIQGRRVWKTFVLLVLTVGAILVLRWANLSAPQSADEMLVVSGEVWTTTYSVKVVPSAQMPSDGDGIRAAVDRELMQVEESMSRFKSGSLLDRFNRHESTESFPVTEELAELVQVALDVSSATAGSYDITVAPLVRLWGFDAQKGRVIGPSQEDIDEARKRVGYRLLTVEREPPALRKEVPLLDVDLSSIAKGYGVDRVALVLEEMGYHRYMVEIGGEIRVKGTRPDGEPWRIGVERPLEDRREIHRVLPLESGAVASSGEYRSFYELEGRRVSHTIDPAMGQPISHVSSSVTVVADRCSEADAWATAMNVLGPERGLQVANELGLSVLFVVRSADGSWQDRESEAFTRRFSSRAEVSSDSTVAP